MSGPEARIGIPDIANRISVMAIRLNQHSPQSVIPSTVNQVSRPRTSGSGKELRRPLRKNPPSGIFFVLCCLDRFCDSVQSDERDEPPCPSSGQSANNRDGCSRPKTLLRSAAFRGQHNRVCILPFSAIGVLPTFTPPRLASEAKKVRGTRRPSSIPPIALCNSGTEARLASRSKRRGQLKTL